MWKSWCAPLPPDVVAIVLAAGRGTRFGAEQPKQYRMLAGAPVLLHAIRPFAVHPGVDRIVVVLPPDDAAAPPAWLADQCGPRLVVVSGGRERHDSVRAALAVLPEECTIVLVHDGARPFPAAAMIDAGIAAARQGRSSIPALPIGDTIKRADDFGRVLSTVDRRGLWSAQTPQAFPRRVLERAHAAGQGEELHATDDAMLVERLGEPVELTPGSSRNLKVTTASDFLLAEWLAGHP
jgi:2-C-methyl-D-erythritol 4-phosphate cytidylyltransferase